MRHVVIAILSLTCLFQYTYAQNSTISVHVSDVSLYSVLDMIQDQTRFSFLYDATIVDVTRKVSVNRTDVNLFDLLNFLFKDADIVYTVMNNQIILSKRDIVPVLQRQVRRVSGVVTDTDQHPIVGANVLIRGTLQGTVSDGDGRFNLDVPLDSVIQVRYVGFHLQQFVFKGQEFLPVELVENTWELEEVVVTALGIRKKESSLTYSTQLIKASELTQVRDGNFANSLSGKVSGVQINRSSSGLGGSSRLVIRGSRSISGNNQPLIVIDGIPIINSTNEQAVNAICGIANAANRDGNDGISNLNADDIEDIHILKGASASALYGSQAANGVVLITTKSGQAGKKTVEFTSSLMFDKTAYLPKFQNSYGRSEESTSSWGAGGGVPAYDHLSDFFQTGLLSINTLSISSGTERAQGYFSYANSSGRGIMENAQTRKHNLNMREKLSLWDNRLAIDGNVNLIYQNLKNKPTSGGLYMNPLVGLYTFPRGVDISPYRKNYEVFNAERNMPVQNWYTIITDYNQNPYWLINRARNEDKRYRAIISLKADLKLNGWLSLQGRGSMDYISDAYKQEIYATTSPGLAGENGRYIDFSHRQTLLYGDMMLTANKKWGLLSLDAVIGASVSDSRINSLRIDSKTASLYYPNVFTISNVRMTSSAYIDESIDERRQLQSVFATALLGFRDEVFLDLTARNDWSSTLAYTKSKGRGFFYPSVGASWILSKTLKMPAWVSFGKIRGSWSKVGNDLPVFVSHSVAHIGAGGVLVPNNTAPFDNLKPEMNHSLELGTEWRFFNDRLNVDLTLYKTNTKNQLFTLPSSAGAAYKYYYVNAGDIQNKGVELTLGAIPVATSTFTWKTTLNFSRNVNEVKKLHNDLPTFVYGDEGFSSSYSMRLVEGGAMGDIYGKAFDRDPATGEIRFGEDGIPLIVGDGNTVKVGNCNPDFLLGWGHSFTLNQVTLSFLIDSRFGGDVLSQTQAVLDQEGVSKATGDARAAGYVGLEGHRVENVRSFYEQVGGRSGVTEYYMYDATNIRLRELALGYSFPRKWLEKTNIVKELSLSVVARNLLFFYKDAPFDPDGVLSTDNDNQGIDIFGMPSTRSIGVNLKVTF